MDLWRAKIQPDSQTIFRLLVWKQKTTNESLRMLPQNAQNEYEFHMKGFRS